MELNIDFYKQVYFQNDKVVPYELKCGTILHISPIKVEDWALFSDSLSILQIDKNRSDDIEIIKMSYMEFVILLCQQDKSCANKLAIILEYALGEKNVYITTQKGKRCLAFADENGKVTNIITRKEFDDIKKIILFQNIYNYDDRYVDPDVEEIVQDYYRIKYKDAKTPNLEEQKTYVIAKTGLSMQQLNNMSYRTFSQVYQHAVDDVIYIGQKIIQGSYKYQVDEDVSHPLYTKQKDKYEEAFESTSILAEKGITGAEKLNGLG